jgi:hypothetical protein
LKICSRQRVLAYAHLIELRRKTPLPDGRTSGEYEAHLESLEEQAKSAGIGGWGAEL